jgi:hypothetical protein
VSPGLGLPLQGTELSPVRLPVLLTLFKRVTQQPLTACRVVNTGIEIAYETFGAPNGRPLLLVMGLGGQMIAWHPKLCAAPAAEDFSSSALTSAMRACPPTCTTHHRRSWTRPGLAMSPQRRIGLRTWPRTPSACSTRSGWTGLMWWGVDGRNDHPGHGHHTSRPGRQSDLIMSTPWAGTISPTEAVQDALPGMGHDLPVSRPSGLVTVAMVTPLSRSELRNVS